MKSSSLKLVDAGIKDPRSYRDSLIHDWFVPDEFKSHLKLYFIAESTPEKLFFHLKDGELFIQGRQYSVTWVQPVDKIRAASNVLVSVRWCDYLERGYALVKVLDSGEFPQMEY